jgi:hypothetical protein
MIRTTAFTFLLVMASPLWVTAQSGDSSRQAPAPAFSVAPLASSTGPEQEASSYAELPYSEPLSPPAIASGVRPPVVAGSEATRSNFISGSFQFVGGFDDNPLTSSSNRMSDFSYLFAPGIMMAQTRQRWNWTLGYNPGFTINQHLKERNQSAHNLSADLGLRLSPHVTLRLLDNFEKTSSLFSGVLANPLVPGPGSLQGPNQSLITPLNQFISNTTRASLGYQFSASSIVGGGATYYFTNYDTVAASSTTLSGLINNRSIGLDGYYAHRFSNKQWLGATYDFQRLMFDFSGGTAIHRALMFYSLPLNSRMSLTLWGGPEYSSTDATLALTSPAIVSGTRWSGAGGAAFDWVGQHTGLRAEFLRRLSDGAGLMAVVTLQQADATVRHQLSARWSASLGGSYANNEPLGNLANTVGSVRTLSATAGLDRQIRDNFSLGVHYGRDRQRYNTSSLGLVNRNRLLFSLSYSFTRPLGR